MTEKTLILFESVTSENPKHAPNTPPELVSFRKLTRGQREDQSVKFFSQDFIKECLEEKWQAELHNRESILWLIRYRDEYMDKANTAEAHAIEVKIQQFLKVLGDQSNVSPALRIDLKKYNLKPHTNEVGDWHD